MTASRLNTILKCEILCATFKVSILSNWFQDIITELDSNFLFLLKVGTLSRGESSACVSVLCATRVNTRAKYLSECEVFELLRPALLFKELVTKSMEIFVVVFDAVPN